MTTTENKPLAAQSFADITIEGPAPAEALEAAATAEEPKKGNFVSDLVDKLRGRRPAESTTQSVVPPQAQPVMPVAQPKSALEKIAEMKSNLSKPDGEVDAVEMLSLMEDLYKENAQLKELGVSAKQTADVTNQTIIGSNANYAAVPVAEKEPLPVGRVLIHRVINAVEGVDGADANKVLAPRWHHANLTERDPCWLVPSHAHIEEHARPPAHTPSRT